MTADKTDKKRFGNPELYERIQADAVMLVESYGFAVSPETANKLLEAIPAQQAGKLNYSEEVGRIYITQEVTVMSG
ncbi:MAG: hypothetical protein HUK40_00780 [Desulfobacter sp.]|nr:hypothetical protein [Desulfobacter sp.]